MMVPKHGGPARVVFYFLAVAGLIEQTAVAWEHHRDFMGPILSSLAEHERNELLQNYRAPCPNEDAAIFRNLTTQLQLQSKALLLPTAAEACVQGIEINPVLVLSSFAVDEPDGGMDQNLPDSADPSGDRKFMGGTSGLGSQGFRHMYFAGWMPSRPVSTFQVPLRTLGQGPERVELTAYRARELLRKGDVIWGYRVLAWAIHYLQDLAQPFHSAQIPSTKLIPWQALWHWPPGDAKQNLVAETTRSISNYHLAYEKYVQFRMTPGRQVNSPFAECLKEKQQELAFDPKRNSPFVLAEAVARKSSLAAADLGKAAYAFLGNGLKKRDYDLANEKGFIDYADLSIRPDQLENRTELERVTCSALATAGEATRALIHWALQP